MWKYKTNKKSESLMSNTMMLYIMTFSTQLLNLATVPYLTRVLGAVVYGKVGLALSYMAYISIIMDFGFILSATQKVAENRDNEQYLSKLVTSITIIKITLGLLVSTVFLSIIILNEDMRNDVFFYSMYLLSYVFHALMPDFLYRGMENMKVITYRTLFIKVMFTLMIFLFIRDKSQYMFIPVFNLMGNAVSIVAMYIDVYRKYDVKFCKTDLKTVWNHLKDSAQFFSSRISSTVYQAANTIILNAVYGSSAITGFYTAADKLVSLVKTASSPVADSLFPYMVKRRNFKLIRKILLLVMPVIIAGVVICALFANDICAFLFGNEYYEAGNILRLLSPIMLVIFPTYILAFPVMVPMGLTKYANLSNVFGMCIQLALIGVLLAFGRLTVYTLCGITSITEVSVFLFRLIVVIIHRDRMHETRTEPPQI